MRELPASLRAAVDAVVEGAGLDPGRAATLRADLEGHFRDGLAAGRTPDELLARFGDPGGTAPLLRGPGAPPPRPPDHRRVPRPGAGSFLPDLRHLARGLRRSPGFTAVAATVLALGIAVTTVVLTAVNEVALAPLPVADPGRLVDVWAEVPGGNSFAGFAWGDWVDHRDGGAAVADLAAFAGTRVRVGEGGGNDRAVALLVSTGYFDLLGVRPALGRFDLPGAPPFGAASVAVVSHGFWRGALGGDPGVVGRELRLDGRAVTVVGVAPEGFTGTFVGFPVDVWLPLASAGDFLPGFDPADRTHKPFEMIGRLRPGATPETAERALDAVAARIEAEHPVTNRGHRVGVAPTTGVDHSLRPAVRGFVAVLVGVAGLVLVLACLNVGGLLLVRTLAGEGEVAVRVALGAGRGRLALHFLGEAALLVALGALGGVAGAAALNRLLRDLVRAASGGVRLDLALDPRVLALASGAALLAVAVAGAAPALHVLRRDPAAGLRARGGRRGGGGHLRAALVVAQVAASAVLVAGTGLFVRSLVAGARGDPGFDARRVASAPLTLDPDRYGPAERTALLADVLEALAREPGVEAVSVASSPVLDVARRPARIRVAGSEPPPGEDAFALDTRRVGAGYLATAGVPLLRGRDVAAADLDGPPVAVVSRAFAERFWPGRDAVGALLGVDGVETRVVGVAGDARFLVQDPEPDPLVYLALSGPPPARLDLVLRAADPAALAEGVTRVVVARIPDHPPVRPVPVRETLRLGLFPQRLGALLVGGAGAAALLLAALGLYGIVQFTVTRDRHELGVRLALGGGGAHLAGVVLRRGFALAAAGTLLGVAAARLLAPSLGGFLVGVGPGDPLTYGAVVATFGAVALAASWLPARRAARIPPSQALRG